VTNACRRRIDRAALAEVRTQAERVKTARSGGEALAAARAMKEAARRVLVCEPCAR
jgi:hypothetical protein